jgi:hypothetical protein
MQSAAPLNGGMSRLPRGRRLNWRKPSQFAFGIACLDKRAQDDCARLARSRKDRISDGLK